MIININSKTTGELLITLEISNKYQYTMGCAITLFRPRITLVVILFDKYFHLS